MASEIPLIETDKDLLKVLSVATNDELDTLVKYITEKGFVSSQLDKTEKYEKYHPDHRMYYKEIAAEIQKFGGSSIANLFRGGKGVPYKEIVCDVADRLEIKYEKSDSIDKIETLIILATLEKIWNGIDEESKKRMMEKISDRFKDKPLPANFPSDIIEEIIEQKDKEGLCVGLSVGFLASNYMSNQLIGENLASSKSSTVKKILVVGVPLLINPLLGIGSLTGVLAGPAYRVTVPTVIHVAYIRKAAYYDGRLKSEDFR